MGLVIVGLEWNKGPGDVSGYVNASSEWAKDLGEGSGLRVKGSSPQAG